MKHLLFALAALCFSSSPLAQKYESLNVVNGPTDANEGAIMAENSLGHKYLAVVGTNTGALSIGGDTVYTQGWTNDIVIIHFNEEDEYQGMRLLNINGSEKLKGMAFDVNDNLYVAFSSYTGNTYTDEDTTFFYSTLRGVMCFNNNLELQWHYNTNEAPVGMAVSNADPGVYVVTDFSRMRIDEDGGLVWSEASSFWQHAIAVANDRVAIAGYGSPYLEVEDTVTVDVENFYGGCVFMFDTTGTALWGRTFGQNNGTYFETPRDIAINPITMDVYIGINSTNGPFTFAGENLLNPEGPDYLFIPVIRFDSEGNETAAQVCHSQTGSIDLYSLNLTPAGEVVLGASRYGLHPVWVDDMSVPAANTVAAIQIKLDGDLHPVWLKTEQRQYIDGIAAYTKDMIGLADGDYMAVSYYWWSGFQPGMHMGCQYHEPNAPYGLYVTRISDNTEPTPNADFEAVMSGNLFTSEFPYQTEEQQAGLYGSWNFGDDFTWLSQDDVFHTYSEPGIYNVCLSMANNCGYSPYHCETVSYNGLRAIEPYIGGQNGVTSVLVLGAGFVEGTTFKLSRDGQPDIIPSLITVGNEATLFGRLNLANAALGEWNVVAQVPGEDADTLYNAFTVEELRPAEVQVDIFGSHVARVQTWSQRIVRVSNVGNEDAVLVPLHIEMPIDIDLWFFAEPIDRHSVQGNEVMNAGLDAVGGNYDILTMSDSLYQIERVNLVIPVIGANSYVDYRMWVKGNQSSSQITALVFPPLINSQALTDADILPQSSPFIHQFQETAEWSYGQDFNYDEIFLSFQEVIHNYAMSVAQTPGGTGGWQIGVTNPIPADIGGIGFFDFTPVINQPPSYPTIPIWIGPPLVGSSGPGTPAPVNPPPPPPPAGTPPPPPPVSPQPDNCSFNGCCGPTCNVEIEEDDFTFEIDEDNAEVSDDFDLSWEDLVDYCNSIGGGEGCPGSDRPDYNNDDEDDFDIEIDEDDAVVWPDDEPEEESGCMNCDNSTGEDDTDGGGSNGSEECDNCDGGPGGQGPGGGAGGGGENGSGNGGGASGEDEDGGEDEDRVPIVIITGMDPNAIYGPMRNGDIYLNNVRDHAFTITFENLAEATAPAQTVVVTDTLNTEKFDVHSLRLINATVGDSLLVTMEPGVWNANYMLNMNPLMNLYLNITTTFDTETGIIRWEFNSIDPLTMSLTQDPYAGFLPPNVNGTEGTGSVTYVVNYRSALVDGDVIENRARIDFDLNEPIMTNTHTNILDFTPPQSEVEDLPETSTDEMIILHFDGSDNISGIAYYHIFVSINNHKYYHYRSTSSDQFPFRGEAGKTYKFFCMAVDKAGNIESAPEDPLYDFDTQITFVTDVNELWANASFDVYPNPTNGMMACVLSLQKSSSVTLSLLNALGEVVSPESFSTPQLLLAGKHTLRTSLASLPAGVYMLQVNVDGIVMVRKVVKS